MPGKDITLKYPRISSAFMDDNSRIMLSFVPHPAQLVRRKQEKSQFVSTRDNSKSCPFLLTFTMQYSPRHTPQYMQNKQVCRATNHPPKVSVELLSRPRTKDVELALLQYTPCWSDPAKQHRQESQQDPLACWCSFSSLKI